MRGEAEEKRAQNAMRTGIVVQSAVNTVQRRPPPMSHETDHGTDISKAKRRGFDHDVFPAPSAGRGAFLIAGDYLDIRAEGWEI